MSHPLDVKLDHRKWGTSPATTRAEYETMIEVEGVGVKGWCMMASWQSKAGIQVDANQVAGQRELMGVTGGRGCSSPADAASSTVDLPSWGSASRRNGGER